MLPKTAVVKESVDQMELVTAILPFMEIIAQVKLENWRFNNLILKLTVFISNFFIAGCHYLLTCSDHGYCNDVGTCQCDEGFYGDNCSSKFSNL